MSARFFFPILLLSGVTAFAESPPQIQPSPAPPPAYIDDENHFQVLEAAILKLARDGRAVRGKELLAQMRKHKQCEIPPAPPSNVVLRPEEVYTGCSGGVVAITSAWQENKLWTVGEPATAWVLTPDGVMVTNSHVFSDAEKDEVFGILTQDQVFYPVTEILAADTVNDIAVFKVPAKALQPLAMGPAAPVGKNVFLISHPDSQFYTFSQGHVTRYSIARDDPKHPPVKYMSTTTEFARGSSGGPLLNDRGAVVGMACCTKNIYYGRKGRDKDDDVQMVVKFCIPADSIRQLLKPAPKETSEPPKTVADAPVPPPVPEVPPPPPNPPPPRATPVPER